MERIHFQDDLRDGKTIIYYLNGKKQMVSNYKQNFLDGRAQEYDENGNLIAEYNFFNGKLNGKSIYYYDDQTIAAEFLYKDDLLVDNHGNPFTGKKEIYYKSGKLEAIFNFVNGKYVVEGEGNNGLSVPKIHREN